MWALALGLVSALATAQDTGLKAMVACEAELSGHYLPQGFALFPDKREGKEGFYAFDGAIAYFHGFPEASPRKVLANFQQVTLADVTNPNDRTKPRRHAMQWTIPNKSTAYFFVETDPLRPLESRFGQVSSGEGSTYPAVTTAPLAAGTGDMEFRKALKSHLAGLVASQGLRFIDELSKGTKPSKADYRKKLDACAGIPDADLRKLVMMEKERLDLLERTARR